MKNLTSKLCLLALVSLICLSVPCIAIAQDGGDDSCCYNSPPRGNPLIQGQVSLFEISYDNMELNRVQLSAVALVTMDNAMVLPAVEESGKFMIYRRQS
jgi:hypothetical protein